MSSLGRMRAVICTNRSPEAIMPCLDALAGQGDAEVVLVISGEAVADSATHEAAARDALGDRVSVLTEPRPGLARARNAALVQAADDQVLAFVDDDALVGDAWLPEL